MSNTSCISYLPISWNLLLSPVIETHKFQNLLHHLAKTNKRVFPPQKEIFSMYEMCDPNNAKVVIIGQDPYHGPNQAHGLSFSVKSGIPHPPSLRNIFKELESDLGIAAPNKNWGDLNYWAKQGVFLLNTVLTVEQGNANSHQGLGWEEFTDATIRLISEQSENTVFLLWGGFAQKKSNLIDENKHLIIKAPHPSPLSAYRGFWGSKPFSKINAYLNKTNQTPIDWNIQKD